MPGQLPVYIGPDAASDVAFCRANNRTHSSIADDNTYRALGAQVEPPASSRAGRGRLSSR